jgi:hypothetical protein
LHSTAELFALPFILLAGGATQAHAHRHCCDIVLPSDEHDILNMFSRASTPVVAAGTAATAASPLRASPTRCKQALTLIKRKQQRLDTSLNSSPTATKLSTEHYHSGYSGSTVATPAVAAAVASGTVPHAVSVDIAAAWLKSAMSITVKDPKSLLRGPAHEFRDGTLLGR